MSRNVLSLSDISAVNFTVAWCLLACSMNLSIFSLLVSHKENTSSMYRFYSSGLVLLWLKISVSTAHMKILAKETASFVPIAVPCGS